MATRVFTDRSGVEWLVWHVMPGEHTGRRNGVTPLPDELADGWLAMESVAGKRRFYPVPPGWEALSDDKLDVLLQAAVAVATRIAH